MPALLKRCYVSYYSPPPPNSSRFTRSLLTFIRAYFLRWIYTVYREEKGRWGRWREANPRTAASWSVLAAQRGEWWRSCSCHGNAWAERCEVGPVCFVVEGHMARWSSAPLPRYHRFNRLELLLRSVTTKWLQRLRRCWEPTERFTVGFITESVRFTATEMCLVAFLFLVGGGNVASFDSKHGSWESKYFQLSPLWHQCCLLRECCLTPLFVYIAFVECTLELILTSSAVAEVSTEVFFVLCS